MSLLLREARTRAGNWETIADVVAAFGMAKALNGGRVQFKVDGNRFRLIVTYYFPSQTAYIKFLGAYAEYDDVDALTVDWSADLL
jgi:mRNA interferase HigB